MATLRRCHVPAAARAPNGVDPAIGQQTIVGLLTMAEADRITWLRTHVWPYEAKILAAVADGIRSVVPNARFATHISQSQSATFALAFYQAMFDSGFEPDVLARARRDSLRLGAVPLTGCVGAPQGCDTFPSMKLRWFGLAALVSLIGCSSSPSTDGSGGTGGSTGGGGSPNGGAGGTGTAGAGGTLATGGTGASGGASGSAGAGTGGGGTGGGTGGTAATGGSGGTGGGSGGTAGTGGGTGSGGSSNTGVGCVGACLFETSFTTAQGWTSDTQQFGTGCGSGFSGIQPGVGNNGAWTTASGSCDEVTTAANYPGGAGGRGFRHYRGNGSDNNGGGMMITLPTGMTEVWYSLRIRFSSGFQWVGGTPHYTKDLYWHTSSGYLVAGHQGGGWGFDVGGHDNYGGTENWTTLYSSGTADGLWHCLDFYHNIANSTARVWVDGVKVLDKSGVNYTGFSTFTHFQLGENQAIVNGGDYYTDYDDLRIDTGLPAGSRLGCPGSGG